MLEESLEDVYNKFKIHFYKQAFKRMEDREATLSILETFCIEVIHSLGTPTINEFSNFLEISSPNATYKINSLIKKGYLEKIQSTTDRREYYLKVTDKFYNYYNLSHGYIETVTERMKEFFPSHQMEELDEILIKVSTELMPEVNLSLNEKNTEC